MFSAKPSKIVATTQVNNVTTQKTEVVTQADVKKDSTTVKQTILVRKTFNSKGKVTSETHVQEQVGTSTLENWAIAAELSKNSIEQVSEITKTVKTYQPNLFVGLSFPVNKITKPQTIEFKDVDFTIDYRLISNFYIFGNSNYTLKNVKGGVKLAVNI
jgi:PKD repeat protein